MTEKEWLECADPRAMLGFLKGRTSQRKLRLFTCSCCRAFWHLLIDERSRQAVEIAEQYADKKKTCEEVAEAFREACEASLRIRQSAEWSETVLRFRRPRDPEQVSRAAFVAAFAAGEGLLGVGFFKSSP